MSIKVHPANIHDSVWAVDVINNLSYDYSRLKKIIADGGYKGSVSKVSEALRIKLEIVLTSQ